MAAAAEGRETSEHSEPDVSVIVPVYNTMPYLVDTLDSVLAQTIGTDRLELIAVDDGSTDESGPTLDRYAAEHACVTAVHQPNSGGPAAPCNRGLELARGRYVYFLGGDDRLAPDALEKLVARADEWGSDVIFGKMEGTGGRGIWQPIFARTDPDLDLYGELLPFAVSNSKMFRRNLVEEHHLRYPEHLRIGSDQPFTIEALVHARRISVLADETYLYVVRREDASNISFSTSPLVRLRCIREVMDGVHRLLGAGSKRDALLRRHFTWELANVLRTDGLSALEDSEREQLCEELAEICDEYLTPWIFERLGPGIRVRLALARNRVVPRLLDFNERTDDDVDPPRWATDGKAWFRDLPGLGEPQWRVPDDCYRAEPGRGLPARLYDGIQAEQAQLGDESLRLDVTLPLRALGDGPRAHVFLRGPDSRPRRPNPRWLPGSGPTEASDSASVDLRLADWPAAVSGVADGRIHVEAVLPLAEAAAALAGFEPDPKSGKPRTATLRLRLEVGDDTVDLPVSHTGPPQVVRMRRGSRWLEVTVRTSRSGHLLMNAVEVPRPQAIRAALRRRLPGG